MKFLAFTAAASVAATVALTSPAVAASTTPLSGVPLQVAKRLDAGAVATPTIDARRLSGRSQRQATIDVGPSQSVGSATPATSPVLTGVPMSEAKKL